ncbi:MAG: heavy-metal-associated domain-containing protein [Chloroflexi bacterium]|jgi:copper chaperone CopZ|nr:heavy-metal-associated domain-containing protein [Chloroflexota bacterium]
MTVLTLELPAMYGDHHVVEVRRILLELKGVEDVYASSGFRAAEITYNAKKVTKQDIIAKLEEVGYIGELSIPEETDVPANESEVKDLFFRHTEAYAQTNRVVSFEQNVGHAGRALWPCPGMAPITSMEEE